MSALYKNALLLKKLYMLKTLGFRYTDEAPFKEEQHLPLPNTLSSLHKEMQKCVLCPLSKSRSSVLFDPRTPSKVKVLVLTDVPSANDDSNGKLFSGKSGEMLEKMLHHVLGLNEEEVYHSALVKCHPPQNRKASDEEIESCHAYLQQEIALLQPQLILAMGEESHKALGGEDKPIQHIHGIYFRHSDGYIVLPTYHPAYLLRNPGAKKESYADLLVAKSLLA